MKSMELSIIYVVYKGVKDLKTSIRSVRKYYKKYNYEIIVVNNDTSVNLSTYVHNFDIRVLVINNKKNTGYGAGNNLGVKYSKGDYILILNPDTVVKKGGIENLLKILKKNNDIAAVSPNLTDTNGRIFTQLGSRELTPIRGIFALTFINKIFPNNPVSKNYYLTDYPKNKLREADAVPGSAFMIKKDIFEKVGGFDEKMFLYFEESDLGKRIRNIGYKLYITPYAEMVHKWSVDKKNILMQKYFNESRFYYFKKHYGLLNALLVELFTRISKYDLLILFIFGLGLFLRFYKARELFIFDSETADNLIDIKNYYINKELPLIGPPTSHPWLNFGPLFYWLYGPILIISGFDPMSHLYLGLVISSFAIIINFLFVRKYWNVKTALLSSFFISVSPYYLSFADLSRFYTYTLPLSYLTLYFIFQYIKGKTNIFWIFLCLGITLNFHFSGLVLIPAIIILLIINKIKLTLQTVLYALAGLLLPMVPILLFDFKNNMSTTLKLLLWIPYRILTVSGIIQTNNISKDALSSGFSTLIRFFGFLFSNPNNYLLMSINISICVIVLIYFIKHIRKIDIYTNNLFILLTLSLILLTLHGNTPIHYYLVISAYIFVLISSVINSYVNKYTNILLLLSLFVTLSLHTNYHLSVKSKIFSNEYNKNIYFSDIDNVTDFIIKDSNDKNISIRRHGENDQFEGNFAQNYQYLLWLKGNEPVAVGGQVIKNAVINTEYVVIENSVQPDNLKNFNKVYKSENILILKKDYEK